MLRRVQKSFDILARTGPFWAVLTVPGKEGNLWEREEFRQTGDREVAAVLESVRALGLTFERRKALDFGCGVGRLTEPLVARFDEVHGVDTSPRMMEIARKSSRVSGRCRYHVNECDNLRLFSDCTFDFIYSSVTLQHVAPRHCKGYLREFMRILRPKGVLVFQLPSGWRAAPDLGSLGRTLLRVAVPRPFRMVYHRSKAAARAWYRIRIRNEPVMEMYGIGRQKVVDNRLLRRLARCD